MKKVTYPTLNLKATGQAVFTDICHFLGKK